MPKVSIIVPVYKAEKYLDRCVESLVNQTLADIEIILIDDGSPDDCPKMCDNWHEKDNRIIVVHQDNQGAASARNNGIAKSNGEYIGFVDSDDWIESDMFETMYSAVDKYDAELILCDALIEDLNKTVKRQQPCRAGYYDYNQLKNEYYKMLLMRDDLDFPPTIANWCLLIKRSIIIENNIKYNITEKYCEDALFGSRCAYHSKSLYYFKGKYLYHYYMNESSTTHVLHLDEWTVFKNIINSAKDEFSQTEYDFSNQINIMVVYFTLHSINTIKHSSLSVVEKKKLIYQILKDSDVKNSLKNVKINTENKKLLILIKLYKFGVVL